MTALRLLALHRLTLEDPYLGLQLVGTVAFAVSGAAVAIRAGMDWLGVAVLAVVTAVGGGTLRDLLLGRLPVTWVQDPLSVWVALGTAAVLIAEALASAGRARFAADGAGGRRGRAGGVHGRRDRAGPAARHRGPGRGAAGGDHRRGRRGGPGRAGPAAATGAVRPDLRAQRGGRGDGAGRAGRAARPVRGGPLGRGGRHLGAAPAGHPLFLVAAADPVLGAAVRRRVDRPFYDADMSLLGDRTFQLSDRYELEEGALYLSGLQALVRIPIDQYRLDQRAGRRTRTLIAGYEGSPLAGSDLEVGRRRELLEAHGVVHRPAVNEELGANAVQGSQLASASPDKTCDGVVGIWYGRAPGLDRATDALRHGNLGGADQYGGVLVMVGDDSVAKSSTVPSSSEAAIAELGMPLLAPADPQDVLDLGLHGIALSRFCGLFTGFKLATNVVDGSASVQVAEDRITITEPDRTVDGTEFRHQVSANFLQPNLSELEASQTGARLELAKRYAYANGLNRIEGDPAARVGIIAAGAG